MSLPLSEILRPKNLDEFVGQKKLIGQNGVLRLSKNPHSLILWGPPGVGKTTLAQLLAKFWDCDFISISAVFSGTKEIKDILSKVENSNDDFFSKQSILFIDEIHRFNKVQQDSFLHHLELGKIILIGATTENPSFEINNSLLSRMSVYRLESLSNDELQVILDRVSAFLNIRLDKNINQILFNFCDGDARKLINFMEIFKNTNLPVLTEDAIKLILPNVVKKFDKAGDDFYNMVSALHKSIRGSDVNASIYWLVSLIDSGIDITYLSRRLIRIAIEDVGLADTEALNIVLNSAQVYDRLGSPEGDLAILNAVIYLSLAPKSNSSYLAYNLAKNFIKKSNSPVVPNHLRNSPTKLTDELNYGKDYRYVHDFVNHYVPNENYWPLDFVKQIFYNPTTQGNEKKLNERINFLCELNENESNKKQ